MFSLLPKVLESRPGNQNNGPKESAMHFHGGLKGVIELVHNTVSILLLEYIAMVRS